MRSKSLLANARRAPVTIGLMMVLGGGLVASAFLTAGSLTVEAMRWAGTSVRTPDRFMWYYRDRFNARYGSLTGLSVLWFRLCWDLLGQEPTHRVLIGRDGWMFLRAEGEVEDARGLSPWTPEHLRGWIDRLEEWSDVTRARGIPLVVAVAPNKTSMMTRMLAPQEKATGQESRYAALILTKEQWSADLQSAMLDLHQPLLDADPTRCYYRTDTHWNHAGAKVVVDAIAEHLSRRGVSAPSSAEVPMVEVTVRGGDLARMMGASSIHPEHVSVPVRAAAIESLEDLQSLEPPSRAEGVATGPRVLLIHDSFGMNLLDAMIARYPDLRARRSRVSTMTGRELAGILDSEAVDAVVLVFVERRLLDLP